jgi:CheY-like chemotaxis protein
MPSSQWQDPQPVDQTRTPQTRPLVVLAEDNDDTRRVYSLILRHYGYRVEEATTGYEAVTLTRSFHPSLVLMDIGLPGLDGFQASRLLKADPATSGIPLIAFSARVDSTADLVGGIPTFDGFILKPVSPRELVQRVNAYLALLGGTPPRPSVRSANFEDFRDRDQRDHSLHV